MYALAGVGRNPVVGLKNLGTVGRYGDYVTKEGLSSVHVEIEMFRSLLMQSFAKVQSELKRAIEKHGIEKTPLNPDMLPATAVVIIGEEFGEVCRAATYDEGSAEKFRAELIQLAAMALATWVGTRNDTW